MQKKTTRVYNGNRFTGSPSREASSDSRTSALTAKYHNKQFNIKDRRNNIIVSWFNNLADLPDYLAIGCPNHNCFRDCRTCGSKPLPPHSGPGDESDRTGTALPSARQFSSLVKASAYKIYRNRSEEANIQSSILGALGVITSQPINPFKNYFMRNERDWSDSFAWLYYLDVERKPSMLTIKQDAVLPDTISTNVLSISTNVLSVVEAHSDAAELSIHATLSNQLEKETSFLTIPTECGFKACRSISDFVTYKYSAIALSCNNWLICSYQLVFLATLSLPDPTFGNWFIFDPGGGYHFGLSMN